MWFFRSDYNTKISSLIGISGIAANINQEFLYLPMQKMSHVPAFNSICYFKGQSFKVMLPSYNISLKLGFKSIYRCSHIHTHLFTCANKYKPFPSLILITLFPFPYGLRPHWRAECTDPPLLRQGSPGGQEPSVKHFAKLPEFVKCYLQPGSETGAQLFLSRREVTLAQTAPNLGSHL